MTEKTYLITGGTGFIGSAIARFLCNAGHHVRIFDNNWRGALRRIEDIANDIDFREGDIRDPAAVENAVNGVDAVLHLAYINGTEFFYTKPDLVLDVGIRGMLNVLDACRACGVGELVVASSSEVYQTPPLVPTAEDAPLSIPDILNPRYSYGGGKITCELLAMHGGRNDFERIMIFRPHNVYGPDMGWEHVLPQFAMRMQDLDQAQPQGTIPFSIQGTGRETRAFNYIDDFVKGVECILAKGVHKNIYHIGAMDEISIVDVAHLVADAFGREIEIVPGPLQPGGTPRRCPDIAKLASLGYTPKVTLEEGIAETVTWYRNHRALAPDAS